MSGLKQAREIALHIRVDLKINGAFKPALPCVARVEKISFRYLLDEGQPEFTKTKKSWRPRGGAELSSYARNTIQHVFKPLRNKPVETLTAEVFGLVANAHKPVRP